MSATATAPTLPVSEDPRWALVLARDPAADETFWYSVSTTGVYCRPSCAARRPDPHHVRLHVSRADAEAEGFRPCRRCRPDLPPLASRQADLVARACRTIAAAEAVPTLSALAAAAGLSPGHFQRVFKAMTGLTPRGYAHALRAQRLHQVLPCSRTVTEALYDAGFNASSRFYAQAGRTLGMSPRAYRAGGAAETIRYASGECSLGRVLVASSRVGVCAILFGDDAAAMERELRQRFPRATLQAGDAGYAQTVAAVVALVETPRLGLALPLDVRGTAFQQRVWQALRAVPPGETTTYTELARTIGSPAAVRAVAGACAANPLGIAIPCHRVIRRDGDPAGYYWGIARKRALLAREAADDAEGDRAETGDRRRDERG